jgi:methylmalonyl-CoA/ethylmalonyl-CoA epimerase
MTCFYNVTIGNYKRWEGHRYKTMIAGMQFDHLGLVVRSVAKGRTVLTNILGIANWTREFHDPINGVVLQFGRDPAGVCYELLEPLNESSPVYPALAGGKAILNHVAYRVTDLVADSERMRRAGCAPTSEPKPATAYGGRLIQFYVTPLRFVIELIEAPQHVHDFLSEPTTSSVEP